MIPGGGNLQEEFLMKAPYFLVIVAGMLLPTVAMAQGSLRPCLEIEDQTKERLDC
jgi:hypothetical protein